MSVSRKSLVVANLSSLWKLKVVDAIEAGAETEIFVNLETLIFAIFVGSFLRNIEPLGSISC